MKYHLWILPIVLLLAIPALATEHEGILVTGEGVVRVTPDIAKIQIKDSDVQRLTQLAKENVNRTINEVLRQAKKMGVAVRDITANSIRVSPQYEYKNKTKEFIGMRVERTINITLRDLSQLAELSDAAIEAGIDQLSPPQLDYSKRSKAALDALGMAIANARRKAKVLAQQENIALGNVVSIRELAGRNYPQPRKASAASLAYDSNGGDTVVFPGSIDIVSRVEARFALGD